MNEDRGDVKAWYRRIEKDAAGVILMFTHLENDRHILQIFLHLFRDEEASVRFLNLASFFQAMLRTATRRSAYREGLFYPEYLSVSTAFEDHTWLLMLSALNCLNKRRAETASMLSARGNMNDFSLQSVVMAFKQFG